MRRRGAILTALGLIAAGGLAVGNTPAAQAAVACTVTYTASQWPGGMSANVGIQNLGDALSDWTLTFTFPDSGQKVTQGWSATWSQSGSTVTAAAMDWNKSLSTGGSTSIGFNGSWSGSNPAPTGFTLNGVACNGGTPSPSPSPSASPSPSRSPGPSPSPSPSPSASPSTGTAPKLKVSGNKIVNAATGTPYRLLGVNRSGGEFMCVQGRGVWDGPVDNAAIDAMKAWNVRAVRVPLNEECWLGLSNIQSSYSGAAYQNEVKAYVDRLVAKGITPIVEMHWNYGQYTGNSSGCSDVHASCQKPMPDAQYAPQFWTGVANAFKGRDEVVFDLFNEPYPERATGSAASGWACWRDGGTCSGIPYQVAGFQSLVNAVRGTGATNIIMLGGLAYSNDLSQWLQYKPTDSRNNLAAAWHVYNFNSCVSTSCWDSQLAPVAAQVPLVAGEIGENTCSHGFIDQVMNWFDAKGLSYLGWTWNAWDCSTGPSLISDYNGTPTAFGAGLRARLLSS
ncbi:cellulase family glycosylhydrolase [Microbispora bryophytorum]|uniref:Endoglucanase n=1 Tax=Microbispora bryophytorum subsp. camponoti TaxID=1677852 RepID=A0ABR8KZQ6_9ACTN|nr:cellulase family glycosylhydrolase [Microbispora camponoti]MBD3141729.1 cellulase family glycosylhydrolase [Microbispora camponoti]